MSSPGQPEKAKRFKGKSGAECEDFIQTIREAAWKEGKLRDALWMADFASLHFSGKALIWHSDLPPDVRQDWFKQEKALLERWPPLAEESDNEDAGSGAAIIPVPAAASLLSTQTGKSSGIGVLQFVPISRDEESMYISKPDSSGQCELSTKVGEALRLGWDRSVDSAARVLEWVDSGSKWLVIHWSSQNPSFARGSVIWARLAVVDPDTLTPATSRTIPPTRGPFRINVWKPSSNGQTTPVWKDGLREVQLAVFRTGRCIFIAVDSDAYQRANPKEIRGHLVFKPIE